MSASFYLKYDFALSAPVSGACTYTISLLQTAILLLSNNLVFHYSIMLTLRLNAEINIKIVMDAVKCILDDTWDTYISLMQ